MNTSCVVAVHSLTTSNPFFPLQSFPGESIFTVVPQDIQYGESFREEKTGNAPAGRIHVHTIIAPVSACSDVAQRRKLVVKAVNIFGNDTMTIVEVSVGGKTNE